MRRLMSSLIMALGCMTLIAARTSAGAAMNAAVADPAQRWSATQTAKTEAQQYAQEKGWSVRGSTRNGGNYELIRIDNGRPIYYTTDNFNAGISTGAYQIRNTAPYNLSGLGMIVGVWDGGTVRLTHNELTGRVFWEDTATASTADHATHVAGTIGASGVQTSALGMAPSVTIHSYEWTGDDAEMESAGAAYAGDPGKIYVSNHSYSVVAGWAYGNYSGHTAWHWVGNWGDPEDLVFGQYDSEARLWDSVCYNRPYYLPFKSAGNDRNDGTPAEDEVFYYISRVIWKSTLYDPTKHPLADGVVDGGYDTIASSAVAKNIMTVGAVSDAVLGGERSPSTATMTSAGFSCWGPTDDGRIKPDIVANGTGLYSSIASSDSSYTSWSGTSMSSPNGCGSAVLLVEYYANLSGGGAMRASTLKGLILHTADKTADNLGNEGPDYTHGWGLMNVKAAADHIQAHFGHPGGNLMVEGLLDTTNTSDSYTFQRDGIGLVRATLCWTDPPATAISTLDNPSPRLVNDLDLRITGPGGSPTYLPYVLDPANPSAPATTGDNTTDNVEQVYIAAPGPGDSFTITIAHKGTLTNNEQYYSLIVSNVVSPDCNDNGIPDEDEADDDGDGVINDCDACPGTLAGVPIDDTGCPLRNPGDYDGDDDVDQEDFGVFQSCLTGEGGTIADPECDFADLDRDTDVDASDVSLFVGCMSGPNNPSDLQCAN